MITPRGLEVSLAPWAIFKGTACRALSLCLASAGRSALVKQLLTRFILKEDQDIYYLHRKQLFETGKPQNCELRIVKPDGAVFSVQLDATAHLKPTCPPT